MRLGTKIVIGFICISLLLAIVGFVTDRFTSGIRQEQLRAMNEASEVVIYTGEMERSLFQSLIFLNGIREGLASEKVNSTVQELPAVVELVIKFDGELDQFETSFAQLESLLGGDRRLPEDVHDLLKSYKAYKSIAREWLSLGEENSKQANLMFINSIEPYFRNNIIPEITRLREYVLSIQAERNREMDKSLNKVVLVNYMATFLTILLAIMLAIYIYRSIANPISKVSNAAARLGEGKLDERIEVTSKDEIGELAKAFNSMAESLQKKTVSTAYLDNIIESIQEALFVTDNGGKLLRANSAAAHLIGYEMEEIIGEPLEKFYNSKDQKGDYEAGQKSTKSFEFSLISKNKEVVPVLFLEAKLVDHQGNRMGSVSVASDISERKKQEEETRATLREKEVMLAEIHHRVKNNLAVISGLLQLQSFSTENEQVKSALDDSQMRIQSIALVHEMLYESDSLAYIEYDTYMNDLLEAIGNMHNKSGQKIKLTAHVEPILLSVNQAIPCSLLINEVIVNALKKAFEDRIEGEINVQIKEDEGKISLEISYGGIGFDAEIFQDEEALGTMLIKTLSSQLHSDFEIIESSQSVGKIFHLEFTNEH